MASQTHASQHDEDTMYRMPESAYEQLLLIRNQLRLVATLVQPFTRAEEEESRKVPVAPLAQGLAMVADQLDGVLAAME